MFFHPKYETINKINEQATINKEKIAKYLRKGWEMTSFLRIKTRASANETIIKTTNASVLSTNEPPFF